MTNDTWRSVTLAALATCWIVFELTMPLMENMAADRLAKALLLVSALR